jgi:hypothetical protein
MDASGSSVPYMPATLKMQFVICLFCLLLHPGKHVITRAQTVLAKGRDGDCLELIVNKTRQRLIQHGLHIFGGALIGSEGFGLR